MDQRQSGEFEELKKLLVSYKVMLYQYPNLPTRVYIDESPVGLASALVEEHTMVIEDGVEIKVWRPMGYTSCTKTEAEKGYGKVDGKSLSLLHGILENELYLYGTMILIDQYFCYLDCTWTPLEE